MKYMLDTNICIYIIKKHPDNIIKKFNLLDVGDIGISSITFSELLYGVEKSQHSQKNKAALEEFVLPLEILPFDDESARHYGYIRASLEKKGTLIGALDLMIAAHAQATNLTLVTNNIKEFSRVHQLKIENWVHPSRH
ncbi:MAG: type toxin-antitoxin system VapC family toxin [Gammaproteobacteria bacterium]|jgi:tRNA(fMet)-specific endonuclease VapC|nr:type toxin-antitoxin system VapC family toxin [Gammaproteobacteria bacterium]MCE3237317.1 type toxin-antitoxin system VapC family toxin [Gammaproteobacteria bacterium]